MMQAIDLFCGAGGTSIGAKMTGGVDLHLACNHWERAIETHSLNFPGTKHLHCRLQDAKPSDADRCDLLFASPECIYHSRARGGLPTSDQQRAGAWDVIPWIDVHKPEYVVIENVIEFEWWGPVDRETGQPIKSRRGQFYKRWIRTIEQLGYTVDWRKLNAADFGAATSRERLFVIARRGKRPPCFPQPTHCKGGSEHLPPWRGAIEVIDWTISSWAC